MLSTLKNKIVDFLSWIGIYSTPPEYISVFPVDKVSEVPVVTEPVKVESKEEPSAKTVKKPKNTAKSRKPRVKKPKNS